MKKKLRLLKKVEEETSQLNDDEIIIYSDEAGIKLDADLAKIWAPKGQQPEILTHSPFGKVNLTGFVCPVRGELIINQMERGNSINFIKQLELVKEVYKNFKLKIYVDNAKWHKTANVVDWLASNPTVNLGFLPKYAPKANPMERHWWYLRKRKTKNKVFDSIKDCWKAIEEHMASMGKEEIKIICQI